MSVLTAPSLTDDDLKRNRYRGFGSDQLPGANRGGESEDPWGGHNRFEGSTGFGSDDYFGRSKRSESALFELPDVHHLPVCAVLLLNAVWCGVVSPAASSSGGADYSQLKDSMSKVTSRVCVCMRVWMHACSVHVCCACVCVHVCCACV